MDKTKIRKAAYTIFILAMMPLSSWFYDYIIENERKESPSLEMEDNISGSVASKKNSIARGGMIITLKNNIRFMVPGADFALYLQPGDSIHKAHNTYDIYVFRGKDKPLKFKL